MANKAGRMEKNPIKLLSSKASNNRKAVAAIRGYGKVRHNPGHIIQPFFVKVR